jgi:hypothetical protein
VGLRTFRDQEAAMNEMTAGALNPPKLMKVNELMARRHREGADLYEVLAELRACLSSRHVGAMSRLFAGWAE